jgi:hypothetical protein
VSLCAGQGRDVIGVLPGHPRRDDVSALLVELDPVNAGVARDSAAAAGLTDVQVREADAGIVAAYADALPARGTVIWTRHRRPPDLTGQIRSWFSLAGFDELAFDDPATATLTGVGVHRLHAVATSAASLPGRLFSFGPGT